MSYEIKTVYRVTAPAYREMGREHYAYVWDKATALSMSRPFMATSWLPSGTAIAFDAIVVEGDILVPQPGDANDPDAKALTIHKIDAIEGTDDEVRELALKRMPESMKKSFGLDYDEVLWVEQGSVVYKDYQDDLAWVFVLLPNEARVLGLSDKQQAAHEHLQEALRKGDEYDATHADRPGAVLSEFNAEQKANP